MKQSIILLAALLAPSGAFASWPDLCLVQVLRDAAGEPYVDSRGVRLSSHCVWTGPEAPVWDSEVCCTFDSSGAGCQVPDPDTAECGADHARFWCGRGQPVPGGGFVCYQPFPSACALGFCQGGSPPPGSRAPDEPPVGDVVCCIGGVCWPWDDRPGYECDGEFTWCDDGYSKEDGTVECFD